MVGTFFIGILLIFNRMTERIYLKICPGNVACFKLAIEHLKNHRKEEKKQYFGLLK